MEPSVYLTALKTDILWPGAPHVIILAATLGRIAQMVER